ncbi:penicillin-insensitive murein endopeptidase [Sorangium sp. Soce836]|uniref:penicillin-insensitive murein endopeptidase n=1 Tax=Sorangium sp. So ce836 TaxID=2969250 RepID=UPI00234FB9FC|nr:penicillin-insensitive murein endopeptidase [Sorangium sp. Soce836]
MPRPISVLFTILALSLPGAPAAAAAPDAPARSAAGAPAGSKARSAAGAPAGSKARSAAGAPAGSKARGGSGTRPRAAAPRARLTTDIGKGHRPRAGGAGPRSTEPAKTKAPPKPPATSVGHPNEGHLEGGVRLDTSRKDIRVVPAYAHADVRWGLPALVGMIERAARGVAKRFPGAVLEVGDLSRQHGGDVHRHNSHESGRDVDLGFYALDGRGKQIHAPYFLRFNARLASTNLPGARFDLPRNWLLVQHLLTDPRAHVSHIFISDPLRHALIAHAKRIGVSRELIVRAQLAMMQPTGSEPHDDHMHVRISCPSAMRGSCIELAKNAPSFRTRARMAKAAKGLRTPASPRAGAARPQAAPAPERPREAGASGRDAAKGARREDPRREDPRPEKAERRAPPRAGEADAIPLAAARAAAQQPMGGLDLSFLRPSTSQEDVEADSDGADASGALDESGALKITD